MPALANPDDERLCHAFVQTMSVAAAGRAVGFPKSTAHRRAKKRLQQPEVAARLAEFMMLGGLPKDSLSARIIAELARNAFASMGPFLSSEPDGDLKIDFSQATAEEMKTADLFTVEMRVSRRGGVFSKKLSIKFRSGTDKLRALTMLAKITGVVPVSQQRPRKKKTKKP